MLEQVFPAQPISTAAGRVIASPFQFLTTGEDNLQVNCWNSIAGVTVTIQGRRLSAAGQIEAFGFTLRPTSDRLMTSQLYPLGIGAILNMTITATGAAPRIGQTFVQARLVRGLLGATIVLGTLLQGYVTARQDLSWPGSPIVDSLQPGGVLRVIVGTDPAAGAEALETVPTGARWALLTWQSRLTTDVTPGDRLPSLVLDDGARLLMRVAQPIPVSASTNLVFYWAVGLPFDTAASSIPVTGIPTAPVLLAGFRVRTATSPLQAGDNYDAPVFAVQEWLEVDA